MFKPTLWAGVKETAAPRKRKEGQLRAGKLSTEQVPLRSQIPAKKRNIVSKVLWKINRSAV